MQYEEIYNVLPNGFHDAHVLEMSIDVPNAVIILLLNAWIGDLGSSDVSIREERMEVKVKIDYNDLIIPPNFIISDCINSDMDSGYMDDGLKNIHKTGNASHYFYFHNNNDLIFLSIGNIEVIKMK